MKAQIKLFAAARQVVGRETIEIELAAEATIESLRAALADEYPGLSRVLSHSMFAVNAEYARDDTLIPDNATVACIPPVSGG